MFFECAWKGLSHSITAVRENLDRHRRLVETQASLAYFEAMSMERDSSKRALLRMEDHMQQSMKTNVATWLHPPTTRQDYEKYSKIHTEYPNTGKWLLKNKNVKKWLDHANTDVTLMWLHVVPGAGTYMYLVFFILCLGG